MNQPALFSASTRRRPVSARVRVNTERDRILEELERKAGATFREKAAAFILGELAKWPLGRPGESLTLACRQAGIAPPKKLDDRAFGPVYNRLMRAGLIRKVDSVRRERGHGTAGGNVWALTEARIEGAA